MAALCLSLSYLFHCGVLFTLPPPRPICLAGAGVTELLSEGLVLFVAIDLVCLWEEAISGLCSPAAFNQHLPGKLSVCGWLRVYTGMCCACLVKHSFHKRSTEHFWQTEASNARERELLRTTKQNRFGDRIQDEMPRKDRLKRKDGIFWAKGNTGHTGLEGPGTGQHTVCGWTLALPRRPRDCDRRGYKSGLNGKVDFGSLLAEAASVLLFL